MGLSEMIASVDHVSDETLISLDAGLHRVRSVVRLDADSRIAVDAVLGEGLRVLSLSLPRTVTHDRRFTHASYFVSPNDAPLPVHTSAAWESSTGAVMFL
jgi:hypothetical protein